MERHQGSGRWCALGRPLKLFGTTKSGETVHAVTLSDHGLSATVLTFGAILQDVRLDGVAHGLTLGSDRLEDYEGMMAFHGSIVGPVANRLGGAKAIIAGIEHRFEPNLNGQHSLHSGSAGLHDKVWQIDVYNEKSTTLSRAMPYGEGGFPANRTITARFEIASGPTLRLTLTTTADDTSIANATNHSYWNLDGTGHMRDHTIQVAADHFLPSDDVHFLVTGEIAPVDSTPFDVRTPQALIPAEPPLDTTFCVANARRNLTECMWLRGASGLKMAVATTEPGLHLYDGRAAQTPNGPFYAGLAIEAQGWPDAPNNPRFPSIEVTPDAPVVQVTEWRFSQG